MRASRRRRIGHSVFSERHGQAVSVPSRPGPETDFLAPNTEAGFRCGHKCCDDDDRVSKRSACKSLRVCPRAVLCSVPYFLGLRNATDNGSAVNKKEATTSSETGRDHVNDCKGSFAWLVGAGERSACINIESFSIYYEFKIAPFTTPLLHACKNLSAIAPRLSSPAS